MKYLATYCLLLAWFGYFMFGQLAPVWATFSSTQQTGCHLEKLIEEKKGDCCAKMHTEKKESKGDNNGHEEKGGCGQSDCSFSCCHLSSVLLSSVENIIIEHLLPKPMFPAIENDLLPNPFLGVVSPPPNC